MTKIAILGAGHGGCTASADLTLQGYEVVLYEMPRLATTTNFLEIAQTKRIKLTGHTPNTGTAHLSCVTTSIDEALKNAKYVFIIVPAFGHKNYAELLVDKIRPDQIVVLFPGTFGVLELAKIWKGKGMKRLPILAECDTLPYATRIVAPGIVKVSTYLKRIEIGVFPAHKTTTPIWKLRQFFNCGVHKNILASGLSSLNPVLHSAAILSIGRIEYASEVGDTFALYEQGYTPSTVKVVLAVDKERLALAKALGLDLPDVATALHNDGFIDEPMDLLESVHNSKLVEIDGPHKVTSRYFTEDSPYAFVAWSELGKVLNIPTPAIDSLLNIVSIVHGINYSKTGRGLKRLGLDDMTAREMLIFVKTGL